MTFCLYISDSDKNFRTKLSDKYGGYLWQVPASTDVLPRSVGHLTCRFPMDKPNTCGWPRLTLTLNADEMDAEWFHLGLCSVYKFAIREQIYHCWGQSKQNLSLSVQACYDPNILGEILKFCLYITPRLQPSHWQEMRQMLCDIWVDNFNPIYFLITWLILNLIFSLFPSTVAAWSCLVVASKTVSAIGSVSMLVGSKLGVLSVLSVLRGTCFDWLSHQGPPISGTRYTRHCIACFTLPGCIMDKIFLNIYKIYYCPL